MSLPETYRGFVIERVENERNIYIQATELLPAEANRAATVLETDNLEVSIKDLIDQEYPFAIDGTDSFFIWHQWHQWLDCYSCEWDLIFKVKWNEPEFTLAHANALWKAYRIGQKDGEETGRLSTFREIHKALGIWAGTPERKHTMTTEQKEQIRLWFADPCYDLREVAETKADRQYLSQIQEIAEITGATSFKLAAYLLTLEATIKELKIHIVQSQD